MLHPKDLTYKMISHYNFLFFLYYPGFRLHGLLLPHEKLARMHLSCFTDFNYSLTCVLCTSYWNCALLIQTTNLKVKCPYLIARWSWVIVVFHWSILTWQVLRPSRIGWKRHACPLPEPECIGAFHTSAFMHLSILGGGGGHMKGVSLTSDWELWQQQFFPTSFWHYEM